MRGRFLASAIFALWVSCAYLFSLSLSKHAGRLKFASVVPVVFLLFALPYDFIKGFNAPEYVGVAKLKVGGLQMNGGYIVIENGLLTAYPVHGAIYLEQEIALLFA